MKSAKIGSLIGRYVLNSVSQPIALATADYLAGSGSYSRQSPLRRPLQLSERVASASQPYPPTSQILSFRSADCGSAAEIPGSDG
jgi:hypothetical protein